MLFFCRQKQDTTTYKPGGLKKGTEPKILSISTGTFKARFRSSGAEVLPFQVVNHGPPPISTAAVSLVTSKISYVFKNIESVRMSFQVRSHLSSSKEALQENRQQSEHCKEYIERKRKCAHLPFTAIVPSFPHL